MVAAGALVAGSMGIAGAGASMSGALAGTPAEAAYEEFVTAANGHPATRYVNPDTGQSVVVDDVTGQVIHVGGPGFQYGPGSGDLP